jgi:hypothetical protein
VELRILSADRIVLTYTVQYGSPAGIVFTVLGMARRHCFYSRKDGQKVMFLPLWEWPAGLVFTAVRMASWHFFTVVRMASKDYF